MATAKRRCTFCRDFFPRDQMVAVGVGAFCSWEHVRLAQDASAQRQRQKAAARQRRFKPVRDAAVVADGNRCRFCGRRRFLHGHHVVYRSEGGEDVAHNVLTLCNECHDEVHSDKDRYQPLCLGLIWKRMVEGDTSLLLPEFEGLFGGREAT